MTPERALSPHANPALVVRTQGSDRSLQAGPAYRIGRDPESDIIVNDSRVSWEHAVLRHDNGSWVLHDPGSTNGTFLGARRVTDVTITGDLTVRLGHPDDGPAVSLSLAAPPRADPAPAGPPRTQVAGIVAGAAAGAAAAAPAAPASPSSRLPRRRGPRAPPVTATLPRAATPAAGAPRAAGSPAGPPQARVPAARRVPSCGCPPRCCGSAAPRTTTSSSPTSSVSRYHAELRRVPRGGYEIVDLDSHNGTFLNGQRISSAPVTEWTSSASARPRSGWSGDELQEFIDTGDVSLSARNLTVTLSGGKVILDDVSFPLGERCLLGVIGPSGAGKSTLLGALTGMRPANGGSASTTTVTSTPHYAELRHRIGLVPQENILHTQLSARRALGYAAELRFPRDTSKAERERRIDEVLEELSLTQHAETRTSSPVRRPAEAGQRRAGAADQAVAAVPGRADLRPGPGPGQVGDGDDGRPGP